jgi:hypothetical protein
MTLLEIFSQLAWSSLHLLLFGLFQYVVKSGLLLSIDKDKQDPIRWYILNRSYVAIGYLYFLLYFVYALVLPSLTILSSFFMGCICMAVSYVPLIHSLCVFEPDQEHIKYSIRDCKMSMILSYYVIQALYIFISINNIFCPGRQIGITYLFCNMNLLLHANQTISQQIGTVIWLSLMGLNWTAVHISVIPYI